MNEFPIWRKPQHHMDVENPSNHVHWGELFCDLVHGLFAGMVRRLCR